MKNYYSRLRKQAEIINVEYYVCNLVEQTYPNKHPHKLSIIAEGPKKVTKNDERTVVIKTTDLFVENLSQSSVVLAPRQKSKW